MKIQKLNEYQYLVTGDGSGTYEVDLMANGRKGSCTCKHFTMRINPQWRLGNPAEPCKHILVTLGNVVWNKIN